MFKINSKDLFHPYDGINDFASRDDAINHLRSLGYSTRKINISFSIRSEEEIRERFEDRCILAETLGVNRQMQSPTYDDED